MSGGPTPTGRGAAPPTKVETARSSAMLVYLLLLVSLQIFLLVVAVEGLLGDDAGLARTAALLSVVLFGSTLALRWVLGER